VTAMKNLCRKYYRNGTVKNYEQLEEVTKFRPSKPKDVYIITFLSMHTFEEYTSTDEQTILKY
jgi:hypothetical protein